MIQSPYRRGADDGLRMGAYFTVMFFASIFAPQLPSLSLLSAVMMMGVPVTAWVLMRRYHRSLGPASSFATLWMYGVILFLCGMMMAGTALTVYLTWIDPGYIAGQLRILADMEGTMPGTMVDEAASVAARMLEARFVPTPISLVTEMIMLSVVTGSGLTLVLGAVLSLRHDRQLKAS